MDKRFETRAVCFVSDASLVVCGEVRFRASAGEVHHLRADQAARWVSRGIAVYGTALPAPEGPGDPESAAVPDADEPAPPVAPAPAGVAPPAESPDAAMAAFFADVCDEPAVVSEDEEKNDVAAVHEGAPDAQGAGGGGGGDGAKPAAGGARRPARGAKSKPSATAGG